MLSAALIKLMKIFWKYLLLNSSFKVGSLDVDIYINVKEIFRVWLKATDFF